MEDQLIEVEIVKDNSELDTIDKNKAKDKKIRNSNRYKLNSKKNIKNFILFESFICYNLYKTRKTTSNNFCLDWRKENMKEESKVITFIGGFYIFGGIIVLLSLIFNGSGLNMILWFTPIHSRLYCKIISRYYIYTTSHLYINRIQILKLDSISIGYYILLH